MAASVNYRLANAPSNTFPAAVADARCAVRWMRQHAADYGGDGSRIAALGYSAGAHLAAMLGVASDVAGLDDGCPLAGTSPRVERVVGFYGPYDLRPNASLAGFQQQIIANFLGAPASAVPDEAALASPVVHAGADDPPVLLVHGRTDFIVPIESSRVLRDALWDAGARATLVEVSAGHGFAAFTPSQTTSSCTTLAFLDQMRQP